MLRKKLVSKHNLGKFNRLMLALERSDLTLTGEKFTSRSIAPQRILICMSPVVKTSWRDRSTLDGTETSQERVPAKAWAAALASRQSSVLSRQ